MKPYAFDLDLDEINRERRKARELRSSQWWKRRCGKGICFYCGQETPPKELTMDHIVPISVKGVSVSPAADASVANDNVTKATKCQ